jgi:hypothetical protein
MSSFRQLIASLYEESPVFIFKAKVYAEDEDKRFHRN